MKLTDLPDDVFMIYFDLLRHHDVGLGNCHYCVEKINNSDGYTGIWWCKECYFRHIMLLNRNETN